MHEYYCLISDKVWKVIHQCNSICLVLINWNCLDFKCLVSMPRPNRSEHTKTRIVAVRVTFGVCRHCLVFWILEQCYFFILTWIIKYLRLFLEVLDCLIGKLFLYSVWCLNSLLPFNHLTEDITVGQTMSSLILASYISVLTDI